MAVAPFPLEVLDECHILATLTLMHQLCLVGLIWDIKLYSIWQQRSMEGEQESNETQKKRGKYNKQLQGCMGDMEDAITIWTGMEHIW